MTFDWHPLGHWLLTTVGSFSGLFVVVLIATMALRALNKSAQQHSKNRYQKQLLVVAVVFCSTVAVITTLPVDESLRNQLLTLVGLVTTAILTLSSTNIAGNAMAGLMLRLLGHFRPGDFVQVQDYFGRVTEQNLFHTEIQTEDRDLVTLPNMFMAANPVKVIHATGTIVSAMVSLGYDVNRSHAQKLLREAGEKAGLTDVFVLVTELGDFSVHYRVCGNLAEVKALISARSNLRCQMLDTLHHAQVEIVSPNFVNQRQVPGPVIPQANWNASQQDELNPEHNLFDKADRAQQVEDLKDNFEELTFEIKTLEETLKTQDPESQEKTRALIDRRKRRQAAINRAIQYFQNQMEK